MFEEVFKTKIDYKHKDFTNFSSSGNTVFLFLTILLFYNIIFTISKQENKIKAIMIFILIVFLVLFYINNKYETNINFSKKYKHVDELINEDINNSSNLEDFEVIFKKLIFDFKDILLDDEEPNN